MILPNWLNALRTSPPMSGRMIVEDGGIINIAEVVRNSREAVSHGLYPGASPLSAFGERTTAGAETDHPVWANGAEIHVAPPGGIDMYVVSTSPDDSFTGPNVQRIDVHYVLDNLTEGEVTIEMNGTTPVKIRVPNLRFVQESYVLTFGANKVAAGTISVTDVTGAIEYEQIGEGRRRSESSFRMVPKDKELHVDYLILGSSSGTAAAKAVIRLVSTRSGGHDFLDPAVFLPLLSVGLQDRTVPLPDIIVETLPEGTIVGIEHTTDKAATITATWSGHLLPVAT